MGAYSPHKMNKYIKLTLALVAILAVAQLVSSWISHPRRTRTGFMSDLYHQKYEEAARMLRAPSAITVASDGALNVVDHAGKSTVVPAAQLPFVVGGDADIGMMTLPSRNNGSPVMLHLSYDGGVTRFGGKIRIESVGGD